MKEILSLLEKTYNMPVDMEFAVNIETPYATNPLVNIYILQCRPQAMLFSTDEEPLPTHLPVEDIIFQTHFVVPKGLVKRVEYAIFVVPEGYFSLETQEERYALGRVVGRLNAALKGEILYLPGTRALGKLQLRPGCTNRLWRYLLQ